MVRQLAPEYRLARPSNTGLLALLSLLALRRKLFKYSSEAAIGRELQHKTQWVQGNTEKSDYTWVA